MRVLSAVLASAAVVAAAAFKNVQPNDCGAVPSGVPTLSESEDWACYSVSTKQDGTSTPSSLFRFKLPANMQGKSLQFMAVNHQSQGANTNDYWRSLTSRVAFRFISPGDTYAAAYMAQGNDPFVASVSGTSVTYPTAGPNLDSVDSMTAGPWNYQAVTGWAGSATRQHSAIFTRSNLEGGSDLEYGVSINHYGKPATADTSVSFNAVVLYRVTKTTSTDLLRAGVLESSTVLKGTGDEASIMMLPGFTTRVPSSAKFIQRGYPVQQYTTTVSCTSVNLYTTNDPARYSQPHIGALPNNFHAVTSNMFAPSGILGSADVDKTVDPEAFMKLPNSTTLCTYANQAETCVWNDQVGPSSSTGPALGFDVYKSFAYIPVTVPSGFAGSWATVFTPPGSSATVAGMEWSASTPVFWMGTVSMKATEYPALTSLKDATFQWLPSAEYMHSVTGGGSVYNNTVDSLAVDLKTQPNTPFRTYMVELPARWWLFRPDFKTVRSTYSKTGKTAQYDLPGWSVPWDMMVYDNGAGRYKQAGSTDGVRDGAPTSYTYIGAGIGGSGSYSSVTVQNQRDMLFQRNCYDLMPQEQPSLGYTDSGSLVVSNCPVINTGLALDTDSGAVSNSYEVTRTLRAYQPRSTIAIVRVWAPRASKLQTLTGLAEYTAPNMFTIGSAGMDVRTLGGECLDYSDCAVADADSHPASEQYRESAARDDPETFKFCMERKFKVDDAFSASGSRMARVTRCVQCYTEAHCEPGEYCHTDLGGLSTTTDGQLYVIDPESAAKAGTCQKKNPDILGGKCDLAASTATQIIPGTDADEHFVEGHGFCGEKAFYPGNSRDANNVAGQVRDNLWTGACVDGTCMECTPGTWVAGTLGSAINARVCLNGDVASARDVDGTIRTFNQDTRAGVLFTLVWGCIILLLLFCAHMVGEARRHREKVGGPPLSCGDYVKCCGACSRTPGTASDSATVAPKA